jgi:hypothetical protein
MVMGFESSQDRIFVLTIAIFFLTPLIYFVRNRLLLEGFVNVFMTFFHLENFTLWADVNTVMNLRIP